MNKYEELPEHDNEIDVDVSDTPPLFCNMDKEMEVEGGSNVAGNILQLFKETKKIVEREDDESSFDNGDFVWDENMFYRRSI